MPDLRLGNVFQLPSRRISRRWTRSGTNLVIFLGALCAQTNLFWREMKIKKMYLKSNTRQENFRTFEERDILNGIKSDQLPAEKTSLRGIVHPVKSLCVLSCLCQSGQGGGNLADSLVQLLDEGEGICDSGAQEGEFVNNINLLITYFDVQWAVHILSCHLCFLQADCKTKILAGFT